MTFCKNERNVCLMACPKVSLQRCHYPRRWNMRPFSNGGSPSKKNILEGVNLYTQKNFSDVCLGICKHVMFAPEKTEGHQSPSVTKGLVPYS